MYAWHITSRIENKQQLWSHQYLTIINKYLFPVLRLCKCSTGKGNRDFLMRQLFIMKSCSFQKLPSFAGVCQILIAWFTGKKITWYIAYTKKKSKYFTPVSSKLFTAIYFLVAWIYITFSTIKTSQILKWQYNALWSLLRCLKVFCCDSNVSKRQSSKLLIFLWDRIKRKTNFRSLLLELQFINWTKLDQIWM